MAEEINNCPGCQKDMGDHARLCGNCWIKALELFDIETHTFRTENVYQKYVIHSEKQRKIKKSINVWNKDE